MHGAINLDGARVVKPLSDGDPSPIDDPLTYLPEQHDCPLPCNVDYANVHKWTPYYSFSRLQRCELPMLLHFSALLPVDDPKTDVLIRSCTLGADNTSSSDRTIRNATSIPLDNPKLSAGLFQPSVNVAPACAVDGRKHAASCRLSPAAGGRPRQNLWVF